MNLANVTHSAIVSAADASVYVEGKTATLKRMSALVAADNTALRIIGQGSGKVAKVARERASADDVMNTAIAIASGNLGCFAAIVAANLGCSVEFRTKRDPAGNVISRASDQFKAFGMTIEHLLLQETSKENRGYNAKGEPTSKVATLQMLAQLHMMALSLIADRDAKDAARRAQAAAEVALEVVL